MQQPHVIEIDSLNLRLARVRRGLRQRDVARQLKIAPQRVSDFEMGVRRPTVDQIALLTKILGTSIVPEASRDAR